jgi:hypothetical protein
MTVVSRCAARRHARDYAAAVHGLAHPHPSRQIGALHTLVGLGQEAVDHRQAVVDVLAAFIRTPMTDAATRQVATTLLATQLHPARREFWPGMSLDLSGAVLADVDLHGCRIDGDLRMEGCLFTGQARLRGLIVGGPVSLRGSRFAEHVWLERSIFHSQVFFDGVTFVGDAWFGQTMFGSWASFAGADFGGHAWFGSASFGGPVDLAHAVFRRSAGFRGVVTYGPVSLTGTTFHGPARVSRRDEGWSITASGWRVVVDEDNAAVGRLLYVGNPAYLEKPILADEPTPVP